MTPAEIKKLLTLGTAISSIAKDLGKSDQCGWDYMIKDQLLSKLTHYNDKGEEVSTPSDFPSNDEILTRKAKMDALADAGKTFEEIIATTSW